MSNITKISLRGKTVVDSKPLYQYDYGQKIRFIGVSLPAAYEVHFSNYEQGESVTVLATSDEVDIPDFLLQSGYDIYVWVYIHTGVSDGETEYQITIPVIERARPTNQEPTPQEQDIITETIAALNDAVTEARDIAEDVTEKDEHVTQLYTYMNNTKNEVYQYKEDAETAANLLKNVSANAETLPPSSDATATYSSGVFNFGIPRGEPGKNFVIKKYVATVEDLPENVEVGTVYGVGTSQPYSIYVFSENLGWVDNGFVQGPRGLPGEKGESAGFGTPTVTVNQTIGQPYASISTRGPDTAKIFDFAFSGLKGEKGDTGNGISSAELNNDYTLTLNYTDGTSYTTEESIRGDTGENGTTYMPSLTFDGTLSWTNDGGKINPRSVNIKGPQGERGPAGEGVPTGGSAGQVLKKASATDYDTEWTDGGGGGLYIVNVQYSSGTYTSDKMHKEITDAIDAGYTVVVDYATNYYRLVRYDSDYSSKPVSFSRTNYSGGSISVFSFTISGGDNVNTFSYSVGSVYGPTTPQNPNPMCALYYDTDLSKYVFSYEGYTDFSQVFSSGTLADLPVLTYDKGMYDPYESEPTDANREMYQLTDAYTTHDGNKVYTGHVVFARVVIVGSTPKIQRFEISQKFNVNDDFSTATVTYSEIPLALGT